MRTLGAMLVALVLSGCGGTDFDASASGLAGECVVAVGTVNGGPIVCQVRTGSCSCALSADGASLLLAPAITSVQRVDAVPAPYSPRIDAEGSGSRITWWNGSQQFTATAMAGLWFRVAY